MIVHGYIETHPKDCEGWIIVMGFKVLLISQHLFREILMMAVLGVHAGSVKIKISASRCCNDASSNQRVHRGLSILVCIQRTIYS
jgi:hypothetical protein